MNVFVEFRRWIREASVTERSRTAIAASAAIALLVWLLVPGSTSDHTPSSDTAIAGGEPTANSSQTSVAGSTPTTSNGSAASGTVGSAGSSSAPGAAATSGATSSSCVSPPGAAPGVTGSQIKISFSLVALSGGVANAVLGIPAVDEQKATYQAVVDAINDAGGIACRKIVPLFFNVNTSDHSDQQTKCLDITAAGVYANVDAGGFASFPNMQCFGQHHVAFFGNNLSFSDEAERSYPYMFEMGLYDRVYHDTVMALRDRGFFNAGNGFKKLGLVFRSCNTQVIRSENAWLNQVGVADSQIVAYDVGCPDAFANPADIQQAVLKFKTSGVTHVTTVNFLADMANFTKVAQQQGFKPVYGLADDNLVAISYGNLRPDPDNIDGAVAIAANRDGEERTAGVTPTAGTARCNAILEPRGLGNVYDKAAFTGYACDQLWMLQAALEHAPNIQQEFLAAGLQRIKSIDFSYPAGPADFSGNRVTTGGQFWRAVHYLRSCSCWQLIDREFHPSYPL